METEEDVLNLNEDADYLSGDELMDENEDDDEALAVEDTLMSTAETRKKRGGKRRHSRCWKHFAIIGEKYPDGTNDVECKFCKLSYFLNLRRSGTSSLLRHMKVCSLNPVPSIPGTGRKIDQLVFRELIAVALIEHNLPFSFVEYKKVRETLYYANPRIEFWCRNTAASNCLKIYEKEKLKLRQQLKDIPGRFCLTTDLWRALTVEGYMCLTAHYIDGNWDLKSRIIDFCAFPPPHTGGAIAMKIVELLKDWGLEKRVFSVTVDNASSNDNMQSILRRQLRNDLVCNGEFFHVRCVAHILKLIVQDGLSVISGALEKIRESVKFANVTESREGLFQSCVEAVAIKPRNGGVLPGLVMDVATRWNSTHLMLDIAIIYREAFRQLAEVEACYQFCPNELEWERAELIRDFLAPCAEMTNLISGSFYPTANLYFMQVWMIENWLRENEFSGDEVICEMVASMQPKFNKYWEEYSDILAIAAVLDPRLKFACLEYCFTTLDASTSKTKVDHIRKKLKKLFDVYKKNTRKNVAGASRSNAAQTTLHGYDVSSLLTLLVSLSLNVVVFIKV